MDKEAVQIWNELPEHPKISASGCFDGCFVPKTKVFRSIRDGHPYLSIYLKDGGWLGVNLAHVDGDLAPFCD